MIKYYKFYVCLDVQFEANVNGRRDYDQEKELVFGDYTRYR